MIKVKTKQRIKRKVKRSIPRAFFNDNEMRMICEQSGQLYTTNSGLTFLNSFNFSSYLPTASVLAAAPNWGESAVKWNYFRIDKIVLELYPIKADEVREQQFGVFTGQSRGAPGLAILWEQNVSGEATTISYNDRVIRIMPNVQTGTFVTMPFEVNYEGVSPDPYNKWAQILDLAFVKGQISLGFYFQDTTIVLGMISFFYVAKYYCSFKDKRI